MSKPRGGQYAHNIPSLMDETPISFYPNLARVLGVNEAIVLQQIWFYVNVNRENESERHHHEGKWWVYNSYKQWCKRFFPWLTVRGVQSIILNLEKLKIVESKQGVESKHDRRKWYTVNRDALNAILDKDDDHSAKSALSHSAENVPSMMHDLHNENVQNLHEQKTENTTEKTTENKLLAPAFADREQSPTHSHTIANEADDLSMFPLQGQKSSQAEKVMRAAQTPSFSLEGTMGAKSKETTTPLPQSSAPAPSPIPVKVAAIAEQTPLIAATIEAKTPITPKVKPPAKRSEKQLANDALIEALRVAFFTGRGKEPVELGPTEAASYGRIANALVRDGIAKEEFLSYVEYWNKAAQSWTGGLTLNSLITPGRISDYKSWASSRAKNAIPGTSTGSQVSTTPSASKRVYSRQNDLAYTNVQDDPVIGKQAK